MIGLYSLHNTYPVFSGNDYPQCGSIRVVAMFSLCKYLILASGAIDGHRELLNDSRLGLSTPHPVWNSSN